VERVLFYISQNLLCLLLNDSVLLAYADISATPKLVTAEDIELFRHACNVTRQVLWTCNCVFHRFSHSLVKFYRLLSTQRSLSFLLIQRSNLPVLWLCWLGDRKGIWPVITELVCWCWWFHWSFVHLQSTSYCHRHFHLFLLQQNPGWLSIPLVADPVCPGNKPLKWMWLLLLV